MATSERKVIALVSPFIEAAVWHNPAMTNSILEVTASPLVEETDAAYAPVADFLADHCTKEINWDSFENPDFMFGECVYTEYRVFTQCPGDGIEHNCVNARKERYEQKVE